MFFVCDCFQVGYLQVGFVDEFVQFFVVEVEVDVVVGFYRGFVFVVGQVVQQQVVVWVQYVCSFGYCLCWFVGVGQCMYQYYQVEVGIFEWQGMYVVFVYFYIGQLLQVFVGGGDYVSVGIDVDVVFGMWGNQFGQYVIIRGDVQYVVGFKQWQCGVCQCFLGVVWRVVVFYVVGYVVGLVLVGGVVGQYGGYVFSVLVQQWVIVFVV